LSAKHLPEQPVLSMQLPNPIPSEMPNQKTLDELRQQYEEIRQKFIEAVGGSADKNQVEQLKQKLESIASQIRKLDVNRRL
jgi:hypothetical protein